MKESGEYGGPCVAQSWSAYSRPWVSSYKTTTLTEFVAQATLHAWHEPLCQCSRSSIPSAKQSFDRYLQHEMRQLNRGISDRCYCCFPCWLIAAHSAVDSPFDLTLHGPFLVSSKSALSHFEISSTKAARSEQTRMNDGTPQFGVGGHHI